MIIMPNVILKAQQKWVRVWKSLKSLLNLAVSGVCCSSGLVWCGWDTAIWAAATDAVWSVVFPAERDAPGVCWHLTVHQGSAVTLMFWCHRIQYVSDHMYRPMLKHTWGGVICLWMCSALHCLVHNLHIEDVLFWSCEVWTETCNVSVAATGLIPARIETQH